jgi:cbb3-type cytochrome oxidase maturation protein
MDILYLLIPLALLIVATAILGFRWATRDGQFDDLETPALRILMDESKPRGDARSTPDDTQQNKRSE